LNPSTTTIMHLERQYIGNLTELIEQIQKVEKDTNCIIKLHDIQSSVVWIRVKSGEPVMREKASALINALTHNQCIEVKLPAIPTKIMANIEENNRRVIMTNNNETKSVDTQNKRGMTRSNTDNQISALNSRNGPFGSFLTPLSLNSSIKEEVNDYGYAQSTTDSVMPLHATQSRPSSAAETVKNAKKETPKPPRLIYTADFLLKRADAPASKKQPFNWKELNHKYPSICFCGKVILLFLFSQDFICFKSLFSKF
jgi:hypothetical protein